MKKVDSKRASREINDICAVSIDGAREMGEGGGNDSRRPLEPSMPQYSPDWHA